MCFYKLQKKGDFFTQMKIVELLQSLTQSIDDKGARYLNKINFRFALDEVLELKKMYLQFGEGAFFEVVNFSNSFRTPFSIYIFLCRIPANS